MTLACILSYVAQQTSQPNSQASAVTIEPWTLVLGILGILLTAIGLLYKLTRDHRQDFKEYMKEYMEKLLQPIMDRADNHQADIMEIKKDVRRHDRLLTRLVTEHGSMHPDSNIEIGNE